MVVDLLNPRLHAHHNRAQERRRGHREQVKDEQRNVVVEGKRHRRPRLDRLGNQATCRIGKHRQDNVLAAGPVVTVVAGSRHLPAREDAR